MFLFQDRTIWPLWIIVRVSHGPSEIIWICCSRKMYFHYFWKPFFCLIFFGEQWYHFQYSWTEIKKKRNRIYLKKYYLFILYMFLLLLLIYWMWKITIHVLHIGFILEYKTAIFEITIWLLSFIFQKCFMHFLRTFMHFPPQLCYAVIFYYIFLSITLTSICFWR